MPAIELWSDIVTAELGAVGRKLPSWNEPWRELVDAVVTERLREVELGRWMLEPDTGERAANDGE